MAVSNRDQRRGWSQPAIGALGRLTRARNDFEFLVVERAYHPLIAHMLARNIRVEEDLIDQMFNSSEKRLARALVLIGRYGKQDTSLRTVPSMTQETLAEMVGTTRSRVNHFMRKFQQLGFIDYKDGLKINNSLLRVVFDNSFRLH